MNPYLNVATLAIRQGAKPLLQAMDRIDRLHISEKSPYDFVSEADHNSESAIVEVLQKYYPDISILSEESGLIPGDDPDYRWVLDPLDGTSNYLRQLPHFAISLALQKHQKTVIALVYDPVRDELFTASKGEGAFCNNNRIRLKPCSKLASAYIGLGGPKYHSPEHIEAYHAMAVAIMDASLSTRRLGSAALDLCYLAAGRIDGYWGVLLNEWDVAAASLIIKEAGALATNLAGKPYQTEANIISASPKILHELVALCQPLLPVE